MDDRVRKRLFDAHRAACKVQALVADMDLDAWRASEVTRLASERLLEIMGEALGMALRLDPSLQHDYPDLRRAVALRNRIIHGYDDIDDVIIWDVIQSNIPRVISQLNEVLGPSDVCDQE